MTLQEKEGAISSLQNALVDFQTNPPEPTEPLSESALLTQAMLSLTSVVSLLTQQLTGNESNTKSAYVTR